MATTTPNYDWPIPEDTDLVKDGAKAIRDLGNAIDTSAQDFGGGLVHIETVSVSSVTTLSFVSKFNANFTNYKIVYEGQGGATSTVFGRLLSGSTPASGANYNKQNFIAQATTFTTDQTLNNTSADLGSLNNTGTNLIIIEISNPFVAAPTIFYSASSVTTSNIGIRIRANNHTLSNSYDGIELTNTTVNGLVGTARLYGYRN
jgi:hypothetical protein